METVDLAFETFGVPGGNPPLVILHGFFASSRNWRQMAGKLAEKRLVYVPDMRNHGQSGHHPVMTYQAMAKDVLEFIDQHKLDSIQLLGHSMGGKVAMWFALNYPDYVDRLVVVDIAPVTYPHSFKSLIAALKALPLEGLSNRKQAENHLAEAIPELGYRQFLLQNLYLENGGYRWRVDLDIFARTADNIIGFPQTLHLRPFMGEALVIAGADSAYVQTEPTLALFPKAQFASIGDAGHWVHVQQAEAFLAEVEGFL